MRGNAESHVWPVGCCLVKFIVVNTLRNLPILLKRNADGTYVAECMVLPGCRCFGFTRHEALENIRAVVVSALRTNCVVPDEYEIVHLGMENTVVPRRVTPRPVANGSG